MITNRPWFANKNDLIGGWAIGTTEGVVSSARQTDNIAICLSEEDAKYIVELVNKSEEENATSS